MITAGRRLARLRAAYHCYRLSSIQKRNSIGTVHSTAENDAVTSIDAQSLAQALYVQYGLRPTYVVDFPVARNASAVGS